MGAVLDHLATAVFTLNERFEVTWLNEAGQSVIEISARHAVGKPIDSLVAKIGNGTPGFLDQCLEKSRAEHRPYTEHGLVLSLLTARQVTVDCRVIPLDRSLDDTVLIVEMVPVDNQMHLSRDGDLIEMEAASRSLIRGVAHEVKNPLGGIRGAAQLLERQLDDPDLTEYTQIIIGEADRLQALVDRMLGPRTLPNLAATNIHELLERVKSVVGSGLPDNIAIKRDYDPSLPELVGDAEMLIQAFLNIVGNACEALAKQGGEITLRTRAHFQCVIGAKRFRTAIQVDVIDNGPGVPEDLRTKLFYPMVTGRSEGTGLGLSIAQSLINHHQGLIEFRSDPGNTVFSIYLPLEPDTDAAAKTDS